MDIIWNIVLLALLFETLDSAAAMGFGTALAPLLFLMGYSPTEVVPVLLISEAITGITDGVFDHAFKNANFTLRPLSPEAKISFLIGSVGCGGLLFSNFLFFELPSRIIKLYCYILVIVMGLTGLLKVKVRERPYRPKLLVGFAALGGFNKGIGGGGFGPVVTIGQIHAGVYEKVASATTSWAEGFVSLLGSALFITRGYFNPGLISFYLLPSIFSGAFFAAVLAPYLTRVLPNKVWRIFMPLYAFSLGVVSLLKFLVL
ncbi:MAG: sulfite exporter TauE/SafE family protein [Candidatus Korarchaeota archaeon]|nr:sulfite exporter TauE/SafE family protein [Candidatus Korarchaeota archaeon]NIU84410.1 TSUP family transporter [Candidatus Thorarchaeota archaeon]NIW14519.1 TSUP family transporter [Candidatus Thorarchaeota archaeon]NIW52598.1 TSUP family transporter [Candidatus Korarchaeota archaeon]